MTYKINIDKKTQKFILKQPKDKQNLIYKAIYNLPSGDTRPLEGHKGLNRLRVGNYRIIYSIDNGNLIVCVVDAGNRGEYIKDIRFNAGIPENRVGKRLQTIIIGSVPAQTGKTVITESLFYGNRLTVEVPN